MANGADAMMPAFLVGSPGAGEMLVVFLAILLLFGAKRLPGIARSLGRALEEWRRSARQIRDELMNATGDDVPPSAPNPPPAWPAPPPPHDDETPNEP